MTDPQDEALVSVYSILSLLHHRGLTDSDFNRRDVESALDKVRPYALAAECRIMDEKKGQK